MVRIGIYGGTFNPPHLGHFQGAKAAIDALKLDKLLMIPDRIAPHKQLPAGSPTPEQRLEMVRLGAEAIPKIQASDLELNREGTSYTYQTVAQIRADYPDAELFLLMGTDMFLSFHTWKNPWMITEEVTLAVLYRGDAQEKEGIRVQRENLVARGVRVALIENPVVAISSTDLRRMLVFRCADSFLPDAVSAYIRDKQLYECCWDFKNLPEEKLEQVVIGLLKPDRVAHVLGCRDKAVELARRYGANETDAARAGLLHDITKALPGALQLTLCREYGTILDNFSIQNPKTLHACTGALVAERIFGENEAVVQAIRHHTTGAPGMNLLDKIIYLADYTECNRDFPGVEYLRELTDTDLDKAMYEGLSQTIRMLKEQGRTISPASAQTMAWLEERMA